MEIGVKPQAVSIPMQSARGVRAFWIVVFGLALVMAQAIAANAQGRPDSFADLAEQISPSVVNITTSTTVAALKPGGSIRVAERSMA